MKTIQFPTNLFSILLIYSVSQIALAEPDYPEDFTPQVIYQDKEYIAQHSVSEQTQATTASVSTTGSCSCPCSSSRSDSNVPGDFEPVILYQDKEYISSH
ncbi:MAG TPA: hypothetical protein ENJ32_09785 [Crenotrichaceae bacterium]|nr:hypothetical protein [Crenotrichaceae bacterium]